MQDYTVNVEYTIQQNVPKTSPKYKSPVKRTKMTSTVSKIDDIQANNSLLNDFRKLGTLGLAAANKINSYVGELTENRIQAKRNKVKITFASLGLASTANPFLGAAGVTYYIGDATFDYQIRAFKENVSASFARDLSGGTVSAR